MKAYLAVLLLGTGIAIPAIASAAQQTNPPADQAAARGDDCDRLITSLDARKSEQLPVTMEQARAYKSSGNVEACRQANNQLQTAASGQPANGQAAADTGKIVVQQPAPQVKVEQAPPRVTVNQGQPQIMIHQPAPTITVDIPQAEVVVRMPAPQVAVQQEKPQVEVQQAKPEVAVNQPQSGAPANVQLEQTGQPAVQYQSDQPKVVFNQPKDQPKIRFEQMAAGGAAPAEQPQQEASTDQTAQTAGQPTAAGTEKLKIADIKQMPVVNDKGDSLGTVDAVTVQNGTTAGFIILKTGQTLGIGEKTVAVPFNTIWVRNGQLVVTGLTNQQIGSMKEWKKGDADLKVLPDDQVAEMNKAS